MAILDSVNELAKRFGVETEEQTISEQIDAINQKLDESYTGSRDIEESVSQFAKNDGPDARLGTKTITENDTYIALDDELDGYSSVTVNVAAPTPETFEVEMAFTVDSITNPQTISYTSTKQFSEAIGAIDSGKNIEFTISITDGTESVNLITFGYIVKAAEGASSYILISVCEDNALAKNYSIVWGGDDPTPNLLSYTGSMILIQSAN